MYTKLYSLGDGSVPKYMCHRGSGAGSCVVSRSCSRCTTKLGGGSFLRFLGGGGFIAGRALFGTCGGGVFGGGGTSLSFEVMSYCSAMMMIINYPDNAVLR